MNNEHGITNLETVFFMGFFVVAALAIGLMMFAPMAVETETPSIDERNNAMSTVIFQLDGVSNNDVAVFVGDVLATRLVSGQTHPVQLDGNQRQHVTIRTGNNDIWDIVHTFTTIDYGMNVRVEMDGNNANVWVSSNQ